MAPPPVVVQQVQMQFGPVPMRMMCPNCRVSKEETEMHTWGGITSAIIFPHRPRSPPPSRRRPAPGLGSGASCSHALGMMAPVFFIWFCFKYFYFPNSCICGCCVIPFFTDGTKVHHHHCPNCKQLVGQYRGSASCAWWQKRKRDGNIHAAKLILRKQEYRITRKRPDEFSGETLTEWVRVCFALT